MGVSITITSGRHTITAGTTASLYAIATGATLVNNGVLVKGFGNYAESFSGTGLVTNYGSIHGAQRFNGAATFFNLGTVDGTAGPGGVLALQAGGYVYNALGGVLNQQVSGAGAPVTIVNYGGMAASAPLAQLNAGGMLTNHGVIIATGTTAVDFANQPGTVSNVSGTIAGGQNGIHLGASGTVGNGGTITGTTLDGIYAQGDVALTNSGVIDGAQVGVRVNGTVSGSNSGTITTHGTGTDALYYNGVLGLAISLTNASGGTISGRTDGLLAVYTLSLDNSGLVTATGSGSIPAAILAAGDVTVTNRATGTISASVGAGIRAINGGGATLDNAGLVTAFSGAVLTSGTAGITNQATGTIASATLAAIDGAGRVNLVNAGRVTGQSAAVKTGNGGAVTNSATGALLSGGSFGVYATAGVETIVNSGTIKGTATATGVGAYLKAGGTVTNSGAASDLSGFKDGLVIGTLAAGTVVNGGTIQGGLGEAIKLLGGGVVTNQATGTITAGHNGVQVGGTAGSLVNQGTVSGSYYGAAFAAGANIYNTSTAALIQGARGVVVKGAAGALTNAGTIKGTAGSGYGAYFTAGAFVSNSGTLAGQFTGLGVSAGISSLYNSGIVTGTNAFGVYFGGGGDITNGGRIAGATGIDLRGGGGNLTNFGTIVGNSLYGVALSAGSDMTNRGVISGHVDGLHAVATGASLMNYGSVTGLTHDGVFLSAYGFISNDVSMYGLVNGVEAGNAGAFVFNSGILAAGTTGASTGISILGAGTVLNTGSIFGAAFGVRLGANSTLTNYGIIKSADAVSLGANSRLVVHPGAQFLDLAGGAGNVLATNGTLRLTGTGGGLAGLGQKFTGFPVVSLDAGAGWSITDVTTPTAITAGDGALTLAGTLDPGVIISLASTGGGETLTLADVTGATFSNVIGNVSHHDRIVLPQLTFAAGATAAIVNSNTLAVYDAGHNQVFAFTNLSLDPGVSGSGFTVAAHEIDFVACFRAGTRIATPEGEIAVERLRAGDSVTTPEGPRLVRWVGHRRLDIGRHPRPWDVQPVRVQADAFGPGAPHRDLFLSPDHALFIDGALVPVRYLLNGASIAQIDVPAVTYFHVELEAHGVLLAENLPCESYLDTGNRGAFEGGGAALALHPDFARAAWAGGACAPLHVAGPLVEAARARLLGRLGGLGHALTADPGLVVEADGAPVEVQRDGSWLWIAPPDGTRRLTLRSRAAAPADFDPASDDRRRLGVAVIALRLDGADIALDDPRLGAGWHGAEPGLRWTDGAAAIDIGAAGVIELCLADVAPRYLARAA